MNWMFRQTYDAIVPVLQRVFAVSCVHCGEQLAQTQLQLCEACSSEIPLTLKRIGLGSEIVPECWAMGSYRGPLGSIVRRGKYASRQHLFASLGEFLAGACLDLEPFDAVVSIPLPWTRLWSRGFNQSAVLSLEVSRVLDIPYFQLLQRMDPREQASKMLHERSKNLSGRFELHPRVDIDGIPQRVVLIDDVVTTGATFESCAMELLNIGVQRVIGVAAASSRLSM